MEHWVSFPNLGLTFPLPQSLATFTVFGVTLDIRFYGVCIALGFLLAVIYGMSRAKRLGINRDRLLDAVLVTAVVAILCARIYYVVFYDLSWYLAHPSKILAIWDGGLAIYGGIIGAVACGLIMCRVCKVETAAAFDLAGLGLLIGQGIGRWGNFFNQEAYGGNTTLPWGMTGDIIQEGTHGVVADQSAPVHPTFLYESLWCLLGFLVLHLLFRRLTRIHGQVFACYLIWYGAGRAWIEGLRSDSLMIGSLRVSQLVAVISVAVGAVLLVILRRRAKRRPPEETEPADAESESEQEADVPAPKDARETAQPEDSAPHAGETPEDAGQPTEEEPPAEPLPGNA